jgi:alpha-L-fucosidase 2
MKRAIFALLLAAAAPAAMKTDIEYARPNGESQKLDACVPDGAGPFPAVILVHGGSWRTGDKATFVKPLFAPLTEAGFAWFSINYRLAPQHTYPAAVDDVVSAVRWVQQHAREYKVDTRRIALVGESAGGHLVALVGARDGRRLNLRAVVPFYAPCDLAALARSRPDPANDGLRAFFGFDKLDDAVLARLREGSPITYARKDAPPFLMIHGTGDQRVPFHESEAMCERIRAAGGSCELFAVEGAPHGIGGWEKNPAFQTYKAKLVYWLRETMR